MQRRLSTILILLACFALRPPAQAHAWLFGDNTLVSIDGTKYTTDDFKHWWKFWNDSNGPLPATPDPYINFLLLKREAASMELDKQPGFKRQTRIFLEARGLIMLKNEAVNSHIDTSEAKIKARYERDYQPDWLVKILKFKDPAAAQAAWQEISSGKHTVAEVLGRTAEKGGPVTTKENWIHPYQIDQGWAAIFRKMTVGQVVDPAKYQSKGRFLYLLKEKKAGDEEKELGKLHEQIRGDLWKEQEDALSKKLLTQLKDKYHVKIDEKRLAALDITKYASGKFSDAPIITSTKRNVSEKEFMQVITRLLKNRPTLEHDLGDKKKTENLKKTTVDTVIGQSLTNWEALDRHYEEKEPFKWEYQFNYAYRMVKTLEQRLFASDVKVTDDEIKKYYQDNIEHYTKPSSVRFYVIDETQGPIDKIWAEVSTGKPFEQVIDQLHVKAVVHETPANHLEPGLKAVIDKLGDGEVSQIFKSQGFRVMAYLVKRTPEAPMPLSDVRQTIYTVLRQGKIDDLRKAYLQKLKSHSVIEVQDGQWKEIQKELGGAS